MSVRSYPEGVPSWVDVEHRDLEAALSFYGGLFGWTFTDATPPGAPQRDVVAELDGRDAAGIGEPPAGDESSRAARWNTYIAVDDADAAAERIGAAGGRVLHGDVGVPPSRS
jgi:uncharacterized protein